MIGKGTFEITMQAEPPFETVENVTLSRAIFDKVFTGPLEGTSKVWMLAARTPVANSAGYVAIERITGVLEGRSGTFVVLHQGLMTRGANSLTPAIVPDSGTGELAGITGTMDIQIVGGQHHYSIDWTFERASIPG